MGRYNLGVRAIACGTFNAAATAATTTAGTKSMPENSEHAAAADDQMRTTLDICARDAVFRTRIETTLRRK
jgi:hypothetical protein